MKSVRLCAYVAILIFSLASFPVAGADTWQGGNRSCSVAEWLFPVEKPLQRYLETVRLGLESLTLSTGGTAVSNVMETPDAFVLLQEFFTELHNASQEVVKESASTIEDCDLSDEVQNFLSTPVDVDPLFDELIQVIQNTSESFPLEFSALVDTCRTVPALEAIGKFTERVYTLESLADEINDMDQIAMQALPPDLLVMIYGIALEFAEAADAIIANCGQAGAGPGDAGTVARDRDQSDEPEVVSELSTAPPAPDTCQWQEPYRVVLDAFMIQVNVVDADSPEAPRKVRDYALNLADSLDDIRENCGLP